jgi:hypothetical protein
MSKSIYARDNELAEAEKEKPVIVRNRLAELGFEAIPCNYARFHQPVPPGYDREPVSEFKIKTKNKYSVESMLYHPVAGLIFEAIGKTGKPETDIVPSANVIYVRV